MHTIKTKDYFVILPFEDKNYVLKYQKKLKGKRIKEGFSYKSNENSFLSISELKKLLASY